MAVRAVLRKAGKRLWQATLGTSLVRTRWQPYCAGLALFAVLFYGLLRAAAVQRPMAVFGCMAQLNWRAAPLWARKV